MSDNKTPHRSSEYDCKVKKTIPFYECFHQQTINLIRTIKPDVKKWLDTGCGTGFLVEKALPVFKDCTFILADPSDDMLMTAKERLKDYKNIEYLAPAGTGDIESVRKNEFDVVTAVMAHHYLNKKDREKATFNCYKLLKDNGIYITFENIKPENDGMIDFMLDRWMDFQLSEGRSKEEVTEHRKRFGSKYFPIKVSEHLKLLKSAGFRIVEIFWLSNLQAGFFCIKKRLK